MKGPARILFILCLCAHSAAGQSIQFQPVPGQSASDTGSTLILKRGDTVRVETFRFYISHLQAKKQGETVWDEGDRAHLIDLSNLDTFHLPIAKDAPFDELLFVLGTDSLTNVSGAMGGDLDPTKGMYWAWNSGYVNLKLEGESSSCRTRNNRFTFHIGGYAHPYATAQQVSLPMAPGTPVLIDLERFFDGIELEQLHSVMSPGKAAVRLSEQAAKMFRTGNVE